MNLPWGWKRRRSRDDWAALPSGVSVAVQPVLTKMEAEFYNLLRLTVQDRYLVLAQVPVWCLVQVSSADERLRRAVLGRIALKRVDFVLIHPGTLAVAKVVELKQPVVSPKQQTRERFLEAMFKEAGIEQVRVPAKSGYSMPALAGLLGLELGE
jgi:Protein of unknown function (DUF2726)